MQVKGSEMGPPCTYEPLPQILPNDVYFHDRRICTRIVLIFSNTH